MRGGKKCWTGHHASICREGEGKWIHMSLGLLKLRGRTEPEAIMCEKAKKSKEERGYESLPICHRGPENGNQEADGESGIPSFREMNGSGNSNVAQSSTKTRSMMRVRLRCECLRVHQVIVSRGHATYMHNLGIQ